eukprot:8394232-Prorocentrum_lima.AAC.1
MAASRALLVHTSCVGSISLHDGRLARVFSLSTSTCWGATMLEMLWLQGVFRRILHPLLRRTPVANAR